jgi:DNA helicase-2/ATP-dependent DNA helicase PcrA
LLILAGAGSGKTRVITHRVAWLVRVLDVRPSAILAITFTNKAASEMKSRIEDLIGSVSQYMWIGTFHAMMMRILRRYADRIGYDRSFAIIDSDDQQKVVKSCLADLNLDEKTFAVKAVHGPISAAKNALIDVGAYERQAGSDFFRSRVAQVYRCYQAKLKKNNSMDFDDILVEAVRLLESQPDVLAEYQERFHTCWSTNTRIPTMPSTVWSACCPSATATCAWSATTTSRSTASAAPTSRTFSTSKRTSNAARSSS